jgi:hypothetical protein
MAASLWSTVQTERQDAGVYSWRLIYNMNDRAHIKLLSIPSIDG